MSRTPSHLNITHGSSAPSSQYTQSLTHTYTHTHTHTRTHPPTHTHTHTGRKSLSTSRSVTRKSKHIHIYVHIHTYTHSVTLSLSYIHTHTHTQAASHCQRRDLSRANPSRSPHWATSESCRMAVLTHTHIHTLKRTLRMGRRGGGGGGGIPRCG